MISTKSYFLLISGLNANIVQISVDIKLGEVLSTLEFLYKLRNQEE